ncbi:MAG: redoxin family protein [Clostridia bacterium]|nr:redoxin family protein [Clostridia bacterium]
MKTKFKNFFIKIKDWFVRHKPSKRRLIQVYAALLYNANIKGFVTGSIYNAKNGTKYACVPGLNCYSCPGATGACPLGALQNALQASDTKAPYYVLGILALFAIIFARTICGFLCPVGLGQELLYKIKTPKIKKSRVSRAFSYLKYVLLVALVIIIPIMLQSPTFCKYICPAGTFGGAIGLLINPNNATGGSNYFAQLGTLFTWKFCLMVAIIVMSVFCFRFFCRFLCPLGAIYGFFNKFALLGVKLDKSKCTDCGLCVSHCKMDIKHVGDHECINCGECISVCPTQAISWKGSKIFLHSNAIEKEEEAQPTLNSILEKGTTAQLSEEAEVTSVNSIAAMAVAVEEPQTVEQVPTSENDLNTASKPIESPAVARLKRRNKWLEIAAWALATVLLISALVYYNFFAPYEERISLDECPQFSAQLYNTEEEKTFNLSDYEGKVVVINFWATWCNPCVGEIPYFEQLQQNYSEDIVVIALHSTAITVDGGTNGVQKFLNDKGWNEYQMLFAQDTETLATVISQEEVDGEVVEISRQTELYKALSGGNTLPHTAIIDKEGKIAYIRPGSVTYDSLEEEMLKVLNN